MQHGPDTSKHTAVVIDSLSTMIFYNGISATCQFLSSLKQLLSDITAPTTQDMEAVAKDKDQEPSLKQLDQDKKHKYKNNFTVLGLLHSDMHEDQIVRFVEQMATTVFTFLPLPPVAGRASLERECQIMNKRMSGRISREVTEHRSTFTLSLLLCC